MVKFSLRVFAAGDFPQREIAFWIAPAFASAFLFFSLFVFGIRLGGAEAFSPTPPLHLFGGTAFDA
jgi:hypothetical protein